MKCKSCNGDLLYRDGLYMCQSCGNKYSVEEYWERNDVYLCYVESDDAGRRTKDSAIAQEIYYKLDNKGVKTFCKFISASELIGDEAEKVVEVALKTSKIVLVIGTNADYFNRLWDKYAKEFDGKKIIPVNSGINAYDIPKQINAIQALNYDKVGAIEDLAKSILRLLGKSEEVTYDDLKNKKSKVSMLVAAIALAIAFIAVIFVVLSKRDNKANASAETSTSSGSDDIITNVEPVASTERDSSVEDVIFEIKEETDEEKYERAVSLLDEGVYAEAIEILVSLEDFKDAESLIETTYRKFAGYYFDDEANTSFRLQVYDGNKGSIEVSRLDDDGNKCTITEMGLFENGLLSVIYTDSEGNAGNATIGFADEGIKVVIQNTETRSSVFIPDERMIFAIADKSDAPIVKTPDFDALSVMLTSLTTLKDLRRIGYEYQYEGPLYRANDEAIYAFNNTSIRFAGFSYNMDTGKDVDDAIIYGIEAPASVVAPEYIGKEDAPFVNSNLIFVPKGSMDVGDYLDETGRYSIRAYMLDYSAGTISEDTSICVFGKGSLSNTRYNSLLADVANIVATREYVKLTGDLRSYCWYSNENDDYYLFEGKRSYDSPVECYYRVYKSDLHIEQVAQ